MDAKVLDQSADKYYKKEIIMKHKCLKELTEAIRSQDWVTVARVALLLDNMSLELKVLDIADYFKEDSSGKVIKVGMGND